MVDVNKEKLVTVFAGIIPTGESMIAFSIGAIMFLSQGLMAIVRISGVVMVATLLNGISAPYELTRTQSSK